MGNHGVSDVLTTHPALFGAITFFELLLSCTGLVKNGIVPMVSDSNTTVI